MASQELQGVLAMLKAQPIDNGGSTLEEQRAGIDALGTMFPLPVDVTLEKVTAAGVSAEWLTPPGAGDAVVLYLHGGGYVIGSIASTANLPRASLAAAVPARSSSIPSCPRAPIPGRGRRCRRGLPVATARGRRSGEAGHLRRLSGRRPDDGNARCAARHGHPTPRFAAPMSPWVDLEGLGESMTARDSEDPMVHKAGLDQMASQYLNGADPHNPLAAPLYADLHGLPPLLIQVGTAETLLDDADASQPTLVPPAWMSRWRSMKNSSTSSRRSRCYPKPWTPPITSAHSYASTPRLLYPPDVRQAAQAELRQRVQRCHCYFGRCSMTTFEIVTGDPAMFAASVCVAAILSRMSRPWVTLPNGKTLVNSEPSKSSDGLSAV